MRDAAGRGGLPIELTGVSVVRGGKVLLDGIDLRLPAGPPTVVLGANGAGKSTLLRVMHGLLAPSSGTVRFAGSALRPSGQAMVFQRAVLLRRSAAANLRYALRLAGTPAEDIPGRVDAALRAVGLEGLRGRSARTLSGGEQQRIALARAAALEPAVLFLDEPTANLDPAASSAIESVVQRIHGAGTTLVMTTHNLAQARRIAHAVVFLHAGRITEITPADRFFRAPASPEARHFLEGERL